MYTLSSSRKETGNAMRNSLGKYLSAAALVLASFTGVANAGVIVVGSWDPQWGPSSFYAGSNYMWWNGSFQLNADSCVFSQGAGSHANGSGGCFMTMTSPGVTVDFTLNQFGGTLDSHVFSPMSITGYNLDGSGNLIAIDTSGPNGNFPPSDGTFLQNQYNFDLGFDNLGSYMEAFSSSPYNGNPWGCNVGGGLEQLSSAEPVLVSSMSAVAQYVMPTYTTGQPAPCFSRSDVQFRVVPEPSVLALMGAALLARGLMRRKIRPVKD
jgi:hypothetical protein